VIILLDAMGGDNAPDATIKGAVKAAPELDAEIILIGDENIIKNKVKEFYGKDSIEEVAKNIKVKHASEQIEMEDTPTIAIKHKKDSSMVVGFKMLKEGEGDVFISAGNSGALLTGATLLVGRIKGVDRPAIAAMLPSNGIKGLLLMDAGANTNCKPLNLIQFAQMSSIYIHNTFGVEKPRIGLLNIGTEETKGNDLVKESYKLLKENAEKYNINFVGNVEPRDCFLGEVDCLVCDGFTGNVLLKSVEGIGRFVKKTLTDSLTKNAFRTFCAVPSLPAIKEFKQKADHRVYGGAPFLGVKKPVLKAHGSSDELAFYYTLKQAEGFVKGNAVAKMAEAVEKMREIEEKNEVLE
jgi:glycerol-3-phosphate acyltransferase PlsX